MESFYKTLTRINSIQNKIIKSFPTNPTTKKPVADITTDLTTNSSTEKVSSNDGNFLAKLISDELDKNNNGSNAITVDIKSKPPLRRNEVYDEVINNTADKYKLPPRLIKSIIKVESNFDPLAVSPKGAQGLMQIMPGTAEELNLENPFQPIKNIDSGSKYFKGLLDKFNGDIVKALAAYNAGENSFKDGEIPNYKETKNYVKKVIGEYLKYNGVKDL